MDKYIATDSPCRFCGHKNAIVMLMEQIGQAEAALAEQAKDLRAIEHMMGLSDVPRGDCTLPQWITRVIGRLHDSIGPDGLPLRRSDDIQRINELEASLAAAVEILRTMKSAIAVLEREGYLHGS